jgi:signal transduction histidine kinase
VNGAAPGDALRGAAVAGGLVLVCAVIMWTDPRPDAAGRHAYLAPVLLAAGTGGIAAGAASAVAAVLLHAPLVILYVEREGLGRGGIEGLTSFALWLLAGVSAGALATRAARERARYGTMVAIQRTLTADVDLVDATAHIRAVIETRFAPAAVAISIVDGDVEIVAGDMIAPSPVIADVRQTGTARFLSDLGGAVRVCRVMLAPVLGADRTLGVLTVARHGEITRAERDTLASLAAYVGLALEHARLAALRRRFALELEEKVAAATRDLTALDRAKSRFVAVASHELRTPLTALCGFSELLSTRTLATAEVQRFARVMHDEAGRLQRIVSDLLDLSRLEQGLAPSLRRQSLDPEAALQTATRIFERPDIAHRITVAAAPALPAIDADPDAFDRIVNNLVANAIKYSPPGPVRVSARLAGAMVEFVIEDDGPGIASEALPWIFEPYVRSPDGADTAAGTGLGLAVVRSLVEAHGGRVRVESSRGRGTRFSFTIPPVS